MQAQRRIVANVRCRELLAEFIFLALASMCLHAQRVADPCSIPMQQPSDLTLQLSLDNGQTTFHEGEIIALTAEYTASAEKKYFANTANYDRSGRLNGMEVFCLDPSTGADPLDDYFNGGMCFMGGGLFGEKDLSAEPYSVRLELNEWRRLPPGSYHLRIVSNRITAPTESDANPIIAPPIPVQSNEVEFEVVEADSAWQASQLADAVRALDSASPGSAALDSAAQDSAAKASDEARHAARVLRFLQSDAAARELAQRFWSGNDQPFGWDLKFGLYGSPHRTTAIAAMKAALRDPEHPVTQEFIQTLALLEVESDPAQKLPHYDPIRNGLGNNASGNEAGQQAWQKMVQAHAAAIDKLIAQYTAEAAANAEAKEGKARAVTVSEMLQGDAHLNPAAKAQLRQMLLACWDSLPVERQNELIEYRWDEIGGPELEPILRQIVAGAPTPPRQMDRANHSMALQRIYELDPDEGRSLILQEMAHPAGDIGIDVLGLLPEHELPQIEPALVAGLKDRSGTRDIVYQLVDRYASAGMKASVQQVYEASRGNWACAPQAAMLRYFLRVDPDYGYSQVRDALGLRGQTGCYTMLLSDLGQILRRPRLQKLAVRALDDPSPAVVRNAAETLQKNGSPKAEAALFARLEKFHEQWKDHPDQLRYRPGMQQDELAVIGLEQTLVQSIDSAQEWIATEAIVHKLKDLASPQMQSELDGMLAGVQEPDLSMNLNWWPANSLDFTVGWYSGRGMAALKEKLAQFPARTHLSMVTTGAEHDRHAAEFAEVESAASAAGLTLNIQTPR